MRLHSPEARVECTKNGDGSRSQLVGCDLGHIQTGHWCDCESVERLEEEDDSDGAVDSRLVGGRSVYCEKFQWDFNGRRNGESFADI
jgi:hypothetical protein